MRAFLCVVLIALLCLSTVSGASIGRRALQKYKRSKVSAQPDAAMFFRPIDTLDNMRGGFIAPNLNMQLTLPQSKVLLQVCCWKRVAVIAQKICVMVSFLHFLHIRRLV